MEWNFNFSEAPQTGEKVWMATKCGKVILSHWVEKDAKNKKFGARWAGLATKEVPIAWMKHIVPEYPDLF